MLESLNISNFTVFNDATLKFSPGLNVIVGENGTGKSHLLKLGYSILRALAKFGDKEPAKEVLERHIAENLVEIFCPDTLGRLASRTQGSSDCTIKMKWHKGGSLEFSFSTRKTEKVDILDSAYIKLPSSALFIPPKEILSVFSGFQGALEGRELSFDKTYLDLAKALQQSPLKGPKESVAKSLMKPIEKIIDAVVSKKDNSFYLKSRTGLIEAQLTAEGHRKLGMLTYLINNGALRNKSSLFWDEPEANLNPKLLKGVAEAIANLSKTMQITIATHSLFLLREFEILQLEKKLPKVRYFGLHLSDDGVIVEQGEDSNSIGDIVALDINIDQSERYLISSYEE